MRQSINESSPTIKQFNSLESAITFIAECVESNSAAALFDQTVSAKGQQLFKEADYFVASTFPSLKKQFQALDFRTRYKGLSFPENETMFKLGGHNKELGHIHIDFLKISDNWVIEKIWQCR